MNPLRHSVFKSFIFLAHLFHAASGWAVRAARWVAQEQRNAK